MTPHNPFWRFLVMVVSTALALRLAWLLLEPLLPVLAAVLVAVVIWRLASWYRGRW